ncbi:MAG: hypothetical protein IT294_01080 [Deltaproteobacteria bacterium]|nr:hypothetical protein [Deltaproteobacteria bacterium]
MTTMGGDRPRLALVATALALLLAAMMSARPAFAHDSGVPFIYVGATAADGGALALDHNLGLPIVLEATARVEDFVLYAAQDPAFEPPSHLPEGFFALAPGVTVAVEVTDLGPSVAVKIGGVELDRVGASVVLGTAPELHRHPEWRLTLPVGARSCQPIGFRLTTDAPAYTPSRRYTAWLTNDEATCAIPTCGDPDGSGGITVSDGVNVLRAAVGLASACIVPAACDVDGSGAPSVTDGVRVLRAAAGLPADLACPEF